MSDMAFGLWITIAGMGVVFGLLGLLWGVLALISRLDRIGIETTPVAAPARRHEPPLLSEDELAAVAIAVVLHGAARRRQAAPEMRTSVPGSQLWASRWLAAGRTRQTRGWQGRR